MVNWLVVVALMLMGLGFIIVVLQLFWGTILRLFEPPKEQSATATVYADEACGTQLKIRDGRKIAIGAYTPITYDVERKSPIIKITGKDDAAMFEAVVVLKDLRLLDPYPLVESPSGTFECVTPDDEVADMRSTLQHVRDRNFIQAIELDTHAVARWEQLVRDSRFMRTIKKNLKDSMTFMPKGRTATDILDLGDSDDGDK